VQQKAAALGNYKKFLELRPAGMGDSLSVDAQRRLTSN